MWIGLAGHRPGFPDLELGQSNACAGVLVPPLLGPLRGEDISDGSHSRPMECTDLGGGAWAWYACGRWGKRYQEVVLRMRSD